MEIYDTPEEFYEKTNWIKTIQRAEQFPVFGGESNLPENPGKIWYFPASGKEGLKVEKLKSDCKIRIAITLQHNRN